MLNGIRGKAPVSSNVEIFADLKDQGAILVNTVQANRNGDSQSNADLTKYKNHFITGIATDPRGNTSAFSSPYPVTPKPKTNPPPAKITKSIVEQKLDKPIGIVFKDIRLYDALVIITKNCDVEFIIDEQGIATRAARSSSRQTAPNLVVKSIDVRSVPLSTALEKLLTPLQRSFIPREDYILI
ncbi:MAG: hypothetical protein VCB26_03840 [Candidatus Hydrogenedentota bacterium]